MIPAHIQTLYNLFTKIIDGHVYAEIRCGMYGLPQAGKLANDQLAQLLLPQNYLPCPVTPGLLWMDTTSDLMFSLDVDDFGVRYTKRCDVERLFTTLRTKYRLTTDWTGSHGCIGLTLMWDYKHHTVDLTIPATLFMLYNDSCTPLQHTRNMPPTPCLECTYLLRSTAIFYPYCHR